MGGHLARRETWALDGSTESDSAGALKWGLGIGSHPLADQHAKNFFGSTQLKHRRKHEREVLKLLQRYPVIIQD